jgi:hypothetical protein
MGWLLNGENGRFGVIPRVDVSECRLFGINKAYREKLIVEHRRGLAIRDPQYHLERKETFDVS